MTEILFAGLAFLSLGMLIWSQYFWAKQLQRLVDKVMSGNYATYTQVSNPPPVPERIIVPGDAREDLGSLAGLQL